MPAWLWTHVAPFAALPPRLPPFPLLASLLSAATPDVPRGSLNSDAFQWHARHTEAFARFVRAVGARSSKHTDHDPAAKAHANEDTVPGRKLIVFQLCRLLGLASRGLFRPRHRPCAP